MHYKKRWQGMLTICRKAGKLTMGLEPTKDAMYQGTAAGVLAASDVSEKTYKVFLPSGEDSPDHAAVYQNRTWTDDRTCFWCAGYLR